jgi:hypothetical protein
MEVLNINNFLSFKTNPEVQNLDSTTLKLINTLFPNVDRYRRSKKNNNKQSTQLLKNHKLQNKKELVANRVNLILNKMSESNIENLVLEFIENINQIESDDWEEVSKTIYLKIISEVNFVKVYLQFARIISYIYKQVQKHSFDYFVSLVETKFAIDYSSYDTDGDPKYDFLEDLLGEQKRLNNMVLIKSMIDHKFFSESILSDCTNRILNQTNFMVDIYNWFNTCNLTPTNLQVETIKSYLKRKDIGTREKVLLENLISNKMVVNDVKQSTVTNQVIKKKPINTLALETDNILDEYLTMDTKEDLINFIETRCPDAITKNKFCEFVIDKLMTTEEENISKLLDMLKDLIKSQILFKSNLSRGLLMTQDLSVKPIERLKILLSIMKSIGITKGLESLMAIHKI